MSQSATEKSGMTSVKEIYKIGRGPSSSHTIGPERACIIFRSNHPEADNFKAVLYGSLALTGKGHGTDTVIKKTFAPFPAEVTCDVKTTSIPHPNTMELFAFRGDEPIAKTRVFSVGGGNILFETERTPESPTVYGEHTFGEIRDFCKRSGMNLWQFVYSHEDEGFEKYLLGVWETMQQSIIRGIADEGVLPGGLNVHKRAKSLYEGLSRSAGNADSRFICAYAFAVGEQNAMGETIVTAPTCGSAGVLPSVLYHYKKKYGCDDEEILHALATAGIIGNLIKTNASITGAECGCQAEIGSACAMTAAALCSLRSMSIDKIEYAAEMSIEHHLGLTCDPIAGLVQIPCIERNAVAAMSAVTNADLAEFLFETRKISLDRVIKTMKETGEDLSACYRETSLGGLAKIDPSFL